MVPAALPSTDDIEGYAEPLLVMYVYAVVVPSLPSDILLYLNCRVWLNAT